MPPEFIEEVKRRLKSNLPTSSGIVGEVIKVIYDQSSNAGDIAAIIERDPPLTAEIIKVANSAFYGSTSEITSIRRAVVTLGFDTIKELVTTVTTVQYLFDPAIGSELDRSGLWLHSVGTARASQLIAKNLGFDRPDLVYTVGLLHDIGKILLALTFPRQYTKVIRLAREKQTRIILAERKVLNTDHCMIGKVLCDLWSLPEEISAAIFYHHDPMMTPKGSQMLARYVSIGDYICRRARFGNPGDQLVMEPSPAVMHTLGAREDIIETRFNEIFNEFMASKDEIESFFAGMK